MTLTLTLTLTVVPTLTQAVRDPHPQFPNPNRSSHPHPYRKPNSNPGRWLAYEAGVIAIPVSPFFSASNKHLGANYVRFAFCKGDDTLDEACKRIEALVCE